ncbi:MAG: hypothetical protein ACYTF1_18365 [Planctomycetota bacterium]|jgi:hypothetical protein
MMFAYSAGIGRYAGVMLSMVFAAAATADSWGPVDKTQFASENGKHLVKITLHDEWPTQPGFCKADLLRTKDGKQDLVWSRYLINNHAPVRVYVTNSGRYVVTMDEWHEVGTFPVVVYGVNGSLVHVHNLESLGLREDLLHIKMTVSSTWWNENALVFFGPEEEILVIRLHWGRLLLIDLHTGRLLEKNDWMINKPKMLDRFIAQESKKRVLSLLRSGDPEDRETGAIHAGQLGIQEAQPLLRELVAYDDAYYSEFSGIGVLLGKGRRVYYVCEAAEKALKILAHPASQPLRWADPTEKQRLP